MTAADVLCRTYIVYHHGLFAQGMRNILEERCAVKVVGMESDVTKALKAVRSLQPEVIIIEECTGSHQPMRLGAFLHSSAAGRVVTLSMDHGFAMVYQRDRIPATNLADLVNAIQGGPILPLPTPGNDQEKEGAVNSTQPEVAVVRGRRAGAQASKRPTRCGDGVGVEIEKRPAKSRAR
jgi:hypothetical protein